jgi:hypothetical protein
VVLAIGHIDHFNQIIFGGMPPPQESPGVSGGVMQDAWTNVPSERVPRRRNLLGLILEERPPAGEPRSIASEKRKR